MTLRKQRLCGEQEQAFSLSVYRRQRSAVRVNFLGVAAAAALRPAEVGFS